MVSIIVPTYNEKENLKNLLSRLTALFLGKKVEYELIFIDDYSTDGTWEELEKIKENLNFPIKIFRKLGPDGKAYSLIEGCQKATGDILVMIDADLQYPPEAIPPMVEKLNETDIVVAFRKNYLDSKVRKFLSRGFKFSFGRLLFGLNCDIQSGLKAFRAEVWEAIKFQPKSPWTFDLEFLHKANQAGFKIGSHNITFFPRKGGKSSIEMAKAIYEIGTNAVKLRTRRIHPQSIPPKFENSMLGAGVGFNKRKYITHTTLSYQYSAVGGLPLWQKMVIGAVFASVVFSFYISPLITAITLVAILSTIYFIDVVFNLFLILKSLNFPPEIVVLEKETENLNERQLPTYSILCPLYREAKVLPQFLDAIAALDWPKDKLDVLLLLEEDDIPTIEAANNLDLPSYVRKIIVPKSAPKTKPKACNYGLNLAKGEYLVIYDAEDIPDPDQLKKAYLAFQKVPKNVICLQAKLNFYNPNQNLITRLFTAEFSLWFDVVLPGLQSIETSIPLGGTSNHFKTSDLLELCGWDPFNVTEDADLGVRLFAKGAKTAMFNSTTLEEANSRITNWLRQRSRWIKGYIQTYLVHLRNPIQLITTTGVHAAIFQLVVGGKIAFMFINPLLWVATILYFAANSIAGPTIEALYPTSVFYMAVISLVFGNFLFLYYYMIGLAKTGNWHLIKFVFLVPFYWLAISFAAIIAVYQLIVKPFYWEKTIHGFHLPKEELVKVKLAPVFAKQIAKIASFAKSQITAGSLLIGASILGNLANFLYNAYLGRRLSVEEFGLVTLVASFLYLSVVPFSALSKTITHRSAFLLGKYRQPVKQFWAHIRMRAALIGFSLTILWFAATPILANLFKSNSAEPFFLFGPVWFLGIITAVDSGFLSGNLKFRFLAILIFVEPLLRLILTFGFVETGFTNLVYAATPSSMLISFLLGWLFVLRIGDVGPSIEKRHLLVFPNHFFITATFTRIAIFAFLSLDVILAKYFLPPTEAGLYALLSLVGKMIFFVGSLFNQFINPVVSLREGAQEDSRKIFYKLFFASTLVSLTAYLAVGIFGFLTVPILLGDKVTPIVTLLPMYGLGILCFTVATAVVIFYQARRIYLFAIVSLVLAAAQVAGIYLHHANLAEITQVMAAVGVFSLGIILTLHFSYEPATVVFGNLKDFAGLFLFAPKVLPINGKSLKILIFNWRDTRHKWAGGAEVYIHELAKRLVEAGNKVTIFCGNDGHSPRNEVVDGIQVIRRGGFYTVYLWAVLYYLLKFRGKFDIVIDSENGIPFFTPLFVSKPIIGLVHHVHQEVFRTGLRFPLAQIAKFLEGKLMPQVYKKIKMITISKSSKEGMEKIGFGKHLPIEIINPGVDLARFKPDVKTEKPSVLYLGRLKPYKSIETAILAMAKVSKNVPDATLKIAGDGESRKNLEDLVKKLGLENVVKFTGKVSETVKVKLLSKAWVMVQPSTMEGWGMTVIEANAAGTPVIAANVAGLKDSVHNPHSGILFPPQNYEKLAQKIEEVLLDKNLRKSLETGSKLWAKKFDWEKSAESFLGVLRKELAKNYKYSFLPTQSEVVTEN